MPTVSTIDNVLPLLLLWSLPTVSTANNMLLFLLLWSLPAVSTINSMLLFLLLWGWHAISTARSSVLGAAVVVSAKRPLLREDTRGLLLLDGVEGGELGEPLLLLPGRRLPERHHRRRGPGPARRE